MPTADTFDIPILRRALLYLQRLTLSPDRMAFSRSEEGHHAYPDALDMRSAESPTTSSIIR